MPGRDAGSIETPVIIHPNYFDVHKNSFYICACLKFHLQKQRNMQPHTVGNTLSSVGAGKMQRRCRAGGCEKTLSRDNTLLKSLKTPLSRNNTVLKALETPLSRDNTALKGLKIPLSRDNTRLKALKTPLSRNNTRYVYY
jgi:hypothetical protein